MRDKYFYIESDVGSTSRLEKLRKFFIALKVEKDKTSLADGHQSPEDRDAIVEDSKWIEFLDGDAIAWLTDTFDYKSEEGKTYQQLWELTSPSIRNSHPMFHPLGNWDLESMIDSIMSGEYAMIDLVQESECKGVMYYDPFAGPFGGSEPLVALVESFGNAVTFDSWHRGPHKRQESEWDYVLAQQLVSASKGFVP